MVLSLVYGANSLTTQVAGLSAIAHAEHEESLDVGDLVKAHHKYRLNVGRVLKRLQLEEGVCD